MPKKDRWQFFAEYFAHEYSRLNYKEVSFDIFQNPSLINKGNISCPDSLFPKKYQLDNTVYFYSMGLFPKIFLKNMSLGYRSRRPGTDITVNQILTQIFSYSGLAYEFRFVDAGTNFENSVYLGCEYFFSKMELNRLEFADD